MYLNRPTDPRPVSAAIADQCTIQEIMDNVRRHLRAIEGEACAASQDFAMLDADDVLEPLRKALAEDGPVMEAVRDALAGPLARTVDVGGEVLRSRAERRRRAAE